MVESNKVTFLRQRLSRHEAEMEQFESEEEERIREEERGWVGWLVVVSPGSFMTEEEERVKRRGGEGRMDAWEAETGKDT